MVIELILAGIAGGTIGYLIPEFCLLMGSGACGKVPIAMNIYSAIGFGALAFLLVMMA